MSTASSITARRVYGLRRVCKAWGVPRSSFYAGKTADQGNEAGLGKRGPKTPRDDTALLALIREDLAATPFKGEGHRKVFGRLRYVARHKVGRNRILRLMRKHRLLSPHRSRPAPAKAHDGRIVTDAPNVRWATDGAKIWTSEDGWLGLFTALEHWNGELLGHHVCKRGDRLAAYEPVAQAVERIFGTGGADAARGVELRHDHGSQYLTDYFQGQSRFHRFTPSFAFVGEPETNGVVERFNRTIKEQIIHGHTYRNRAELAAAVAAFALLYNREWRLEKLRYRSPLEARRDHQNSIPLAA